MSVHVHECVQVEEIMCLNTMGGVESEEELVWESGAGGGEEMSLE